MERKIDLTGLLAYIDPSTCSYQEWVCVGMALKHEGYPVSLWEDWSMKDSRRYRKGECSRKWDSFQEGTFEIVTGGTIYQMALESGYIPERGHEIEWGSEIKEDNRIVDVNWLENKEVSEPRKWDPVQQIIDYLETLFEPAENVGYVMESYQDPEKGKYIPKNKGAYARTAGELIEALRKCKGDIGAALGDYNEAGGAWIRFNPLDGKGVNNANVTEFRYALVESDSMEIEKQNALIRDLELPVAVLVHSGGKSLHAIVRIDAQDYSEYRKRVDYLYDICKQNGMTIDTQNRNPSRLSRMPGIKRGDQKQFIVDKNIGKASWQEWKEWIESVTDNLPDFEDLDSVWNDIPELAPELIGGILRNGHKMLIAGPSKAGKSFLQIELAICIAEGVKWLGHQCTQGRVLYVNLELDRASCLHRFYDVYKEMQLPPVHRQNIDIWNLRGKAIPMDALVPKLIRRAQKKNLAAVIIDPIYKVITGDENSAEHMAKFCNQFDKICADLGCAAIYCHHHSKGAQGGKKSMDRASGSGVFARDPDAQLDIVELPVKDELRKQQTDRAICDEIVNNGWLERANEAWEKDLGQDDLLVAGRLISYIENSLDDEWTQLNFQRTIEKVIKRHQEKTAWRIEATLREFPTPAPQDVWFEYPIHRIDDVGVLNDVQPEEEKTPRERILERNKKAHAEAVDKFEIVFTNLEMSGAPIALQALSEALDTAPSTVGAWLGNGKKKKKDLAERFETYYREDKKKYVRRRIGEGATPESVQGSHPKSDGGATPC